MTTNTTNASSTYTVIPTLPTRTLWVFCDKAGDCGGRTAAVTFLCNLWNQLNGPVTLGFAWVHFDCTTALMNIGGSLISSWKWAAWYGVCLGIHVNAWGSAYNYYESRVPFGRPNISWAEAVYENSDYYVATSSCSAAA